MIQNSKLKYQRSKFTEKTDKEKLLDGVRRIGGQVGGIEKMIEEEKDCLAIIQQISAIRSALSSIAVKILIQESCSCEVGNDRKKFENVIKNLINSI